MKSELAQDNYYYDKNLISELEKLYVKLGKKYLKIQAQVNNYNYVKVEQFVKWIDDLYALQKTLKRLKIVIKMVKSDNASLMFVWVDIDNIEKWNPFKDEDNE